MTISVSTKTRVSVNLHQSGDEEKAAGVLTHRSNRPVMRMATRRALSSTASAPAVRPAGRSRSRRASAGGSSG